jgi:hypothetical protein
MRSEEDGRGQEPTMEFLMMMILLLFQRKTSFWTRERLFLASKQAREARKATRVVLNCWCRRRTKRVSFLTFMRASYIWLWGV